MDKRLNKRFIRQDGCSVNNGPTLLEKKRYEGNTDQQQQQQKVSVVDRSTSALFINVIDVRSERLTSVRVAVICGPGSSEPVVT